MGSDVERGEVASLEFGEGGGGDHRSVIGGESGGWEVHRIGKVGGTGRGSQSRIAGDSTGNDEAAGSDGFGSGGSARKQLVDHRMLKRSQ